MQNERISCSIRLTFLSSTSKSAQVAFTDFQFFGEFFNEKTVMNLIPKEIAIESKIEFPFNEENHFGLFYFFRNSSIKTRNQIFCFNAGSENGSLAEILTIWNEEIWVPEDHKNLSFGIYFPDFTFKITGYRFKIRKK